MMLFTGLCAAASEVLVLHGFVYTWTLTLPRVQALLAAEVRGSERSHHIQAAVESGIWSEPADRPQGEACWVESEPWGPRRMKLQRAADQELTGSCHIQNQQAMELTGTAARTSLDVEQLIQCHMYAVVSGINTVCRHSVHCPFVWMLPVMCVVLLLLLCFVGNRECIKRVTRLSAFYDFVWLARTVSVCDNKHIDISLNPALNFSALNLTIYQASLLQSSQDITIFLCEMGPWKPFLLDLREQRAVNASIFCSRLFVCPFWQHGVCQFYRIFWSSTRKQLRLTWQVFDEIFVKKDNGSDAGNCSFLQSM